MEEHARFTEPDIILPVQYYGALTRSRAETQGECRLLYAVLDDAVRCFQRTAYSDQPQERELFAETAAWIDDAGQASAPEAGLSFVGVCAALGIDPGFLRARLWQWHQAQRHSGKRRQRCRV